jgi:hypothetical protein
MRGSCQFVQALRENPLESIVGEAGPVEEIDEVADGTGTVGCSVQRM